MSPRNCKVSKCFEKMGVPPQQGLFWGCREEVISHLPTKHSSFSRPHFMILGEPHLGSVIKSFHEIKKKNVTLSIKSPFHRVRKLRLWHTGDKGVTLGPGGPLRQRAHLIPVAASCSSQTRFSQAWTRRGKEGCRHPSIRDLPQHLYPILSLVPASPGLQTPQHELSYSKQENKFKASLG